MTERKEDGSKITDLQLSIKRIKPKASNRNLGMAIMFSFTIFALGKFLDARQAIKLKESNKNTKKYRLSHKNKIRIPADVLESDPWDSQSINSSRNINDNSEFSLQNLESFITSTEK